MLTGQFLPSSGDIFMPQKYDLISGNNIPEQVGLCPQNNVLIPNLTAAEHLELYARIKMGRGYKSEVSRILQILSLGKYEKYKSHELSGGFKRRLCIANAFIGSPNLVILDEPCSGVDAKARKNIWDLIKTLKHGRAVILATHYLDEAEHLSDVIVMLNKGRAVAENTPDELRNTFSKAFQMKVIFTPGGNTDKTREHLFSILATELKQFEIIHDSNSEISVTIPYRDDTGNICNFSSFIKSIETLESQKQIVEFKIKSKNLQDIFNKMNEDNNMSNGRNGKIHNGVNGVNGDAPSRTQFELKNTSTLDHVKNLFWKRFVHFHRNFRVLLCILVMPTIFEIIAMAFMNLRPPGGHTNILKFSKNIYAGSKEFYSMENGTEYTNGTFQVLTSGCDNKCDFFNSSKLAFKWILDTQNDYVERR